MDWCRICALRAPAAAGHSRPRVSQRGREPQEPAAVWRVRAVFTAGPPRDSPLARSCPMRKTLPGDRGTLCAAPVCLVREGRRQSQLPAGPKVRGSPWGRWRAKPTVSLPVRGQASQGDGAREKNECQASALSGPGLGFHAGPSPIGMGARGRACSSRGFSAAQAAVLSCNFSSGRSRYVGSESPFGL